MDDVHKANVLDVQSRKTEAHQQEMRRIQKEAQREASQKNKEAMEKTRQATNARMTQIERNLVDQAKQMAQKGKDFCIMLCLTFF